MIQRGGAKIFCISFTFLFSVSLALLPLAAEGADLIIVSDTISTSVPGASANHTIKFTVTNTIPVSGKIIVTPQAGVFTIPAGLDYTDIDFLDDGINQTLSASSGSGSGSAIGISITTGTSGSITFILNNTDVLAAGSVITIKINNQQIKNPAAAGSYKITIKTFDSAGELIDEGSAMAVIINQITVSSNNVQLIEEELVTAPKAVKDGGMIMGITPSVTEAKPPLSLEQIIDGIRQKIILLIQQIIILVNNQINILREQIQQLTVPPAPPIKTIPSAEVKIVPEELKIMPQPEVKSVEPESEQPIKQLEKPIIIPRVLIAISVFIGILTLFVLIK